MNTQKLNRIPYVMVLALVGLAVAACTIHLRGDEEQAKMLEPNSTPPDPLAAKLAACRSVTYEQKDALGECRRSAANSSDRRLQHHPIVGCPKRGPRYS
jgi:conjugative transfer region protein TrbK